MLERTTAPTQRPQPTSLAAPNIGSFTPEVRLRSTDGEVELVGRHGEMSMTYAFVTMLTFNNYPGATSKIMTTDQRPAILAHIQDDPRDRQGRSVAFLVKLDPDKAGDRRSLK